MVAYSFKSRFEVAIREGWKTQTIRRGRARHARPGEMLEHGPMAGTEFSGVLIEWAAPRADAAIQQMEAA